KRKDDDRRNGHEDVWDVADALRSARGSAFVTEQIWGEAWLLVTGSTKVGIRPEIEEQSQAAQFRMRAVTEAPIKGEFSLVESQRPARVKKDPDAPDGRRTNGGTPPVRRAGDSQPNSPIARTQARVERTTDNDTKKDSQ
ncbi:MAG: hypothetical protein HOV66_26080, partial [Streptomycetaceae bacterium]|nr:hypothetical protein [Streptomycetaceae bacterium]